MHVQMYVHRINMVCIAFAAFPLMFCRLINVDILLLFLTIFIHYKTVMHDNWHIVDAIYMHLVQVYLLIV